MTERLREAVAGLADRLVLDYPHGTPAGAWWVPARFGGGAPTPEEGQRYVERIRRTNFDRRATG